MNTGVIRRWLPGLVALAAMGLVACSGASPAGPAFRATPFVPSGPPPPTPAPLAPEVMRPALGTPIPEARARAIMDLWLEPQPDPVALAAAHEEIRAHRDVRFLAPLIELLRAGRAHFAYIDPSYVELIESLAGTTYGWAWDRWADWYARTSITPPPGFTGWKGRLMAGVDSDFARLLAEDAPSTIRVELIAWASVQVDGVVSLEQPPSIAAEAATYLEPGEPVYGLVVQGEARAYPLRIMDAHEMANDVLGEVPVAITHCPLCGSGVAYDRRGPDGRVYSLGTSGLLFDSNKLMYDRETWSLWHQFTGRPVLGSLVTVAEGTHGSWLPVLPLVVTTWEAWRREHPETTVLALETGAGTGYRPGLPYLQYYTSPDLIFPVSNRRPLLPAKAWVYGIAEDGVAKAYAGRMLRRERVVNDRVGARDLVVVAAGQWVEVSTDGGPFGELSYQAGIEIRAYERPPSLNFRPGEVDGEVYDHRGRTWRITEEALLGPDGEALRRITGQLAFWFGWYSFYPETELVGGR